MELSAFSENIVTAKFIRNSEELELQVNIDVVTPEYLDQMDLAMKAASKRIEKVIKIREKKKEVDESGLSLERDLLILQREVHAAFLTDKVKLPTGGTSSLLLAWDLSEDGQPVECSRENVLRLPPKAVEALCRFCVKQAKTVKKNEETDEGETLESTPAGSPALRVVGQAT